MPAILLTFKVLSVLGFAIILVCGYIASVESTSRRTVKAALTAKLIFCVWLCLVPILKFTSDQTLPIYEFTGVIQSIDVLDGSSKRYSAWLVIQLANGAAIHVHATGRSPHFLSGQRIKVRYRGGTSELVKAYFYSSTGDQIGAYQHAWLLYDVPLLLVGLFCIWASVRKYRRDVRSLEE